MIINFGVHQSNLRENRITQLVRMCFAHKHFWLCALWWLTKIGVKKSGSKSGSGLSLCIIIVVYFLVLLKKARENWEKTDVRSFFVHSFCRIKNWKKPFLQCLPYKRQCICTKKDLTHTFFFFYCVSLSKPLWQLPNHFQLFFACKEWGRYQGNLFRAPLNLYFHRSGNYG